MEKIIVGIQARSSSTRLPNKSMMSLCGKPLWQWSYDTCSRVYKTVMLIPYYDPLKKSIIDHGADFIEGPLDDVLRRYELLMDIKNPDFIIRVTADCPLIDPIALAWLGHNNDYDYLIHQPLDGMDCELISKRLLRFICANANDTQREHVTTYIHDNWDTLMYKYRLSNYCKLKTSIDTMDDLILTERLINESLG